MADEPKIIGYKNTQSQQVRFFRGDNSDTIRPAVPIGTWSVREIGEFPAEVTAFQFETVVQTQVFFANGRVDSFDNVVARSPHYLIREKARFRRCDIEGRDPNHNLVRVHPDLDDKFWVVTSHHSQAEPEKAAA